MWLVYDTNLCYHQMFGLGGLIFCISLVRAWSGFTWRVSDCEELVGLLTGDDRGGRLLRVGDSREWLWCSRATLPPRVSIRRGENCSRITHYKHKVGPDSMSMLVCATVPCNVRNCESIWVVIVNSETTSFSQEENKLERTSSADYIYMSMDNFKRSKASLSSQSIFELATFTDGQNILLKYRR